METISDDPSPMEGLGTGADDGTTSQQPPRAFTPPHTAAAGLQVSPADMGTAERRHAGASPSPGGPINGQPPPTAQGFLQQPQQALLSHHHHQQQQQQLLQHHQGMQSSEPSPLQQQHMMQYSMPQLQQQLPLIQSQPPQQQRAPNPATASAVNPGVVAQPPYGKYFMQRVTTNVAHVLFYVVDSRGFAKLAVVVSLRPVCQQSAAMFCNATAPYLLNLITPAVDMKVTDRRSIAYSPTYWLAAGCHCHGTLLPALLQSGSSL